MTELKQSEIQELIDMNFKLNFLLGYVTPLIHELKNYKQINDENITHCDWFFEAIKNIIYLKKGLPPFL